MAATSEHVKDIWQEARTFANERERHVSEEARWLWASIEDKPHRALHYIQDTIEAVTRHPDAVAEAARKLRDDVRSRHPDEAWSCPLMAALDEALKELDSSRG